MGHEYISLNGYVQFTGRQYTNEAPTMLYKLYGQRRNCQLFIMIVMKIMKDERYIYIEGTQSK